jgi:excisionase family DNA binding protein
MRRLRIRYLKMKKMSTPAKPASAPADEIMTVLTLARYLRCDKTTIYKLLKKKQIPAFRIGSGPISDWRFSAPPSMSGLRSTRSPTRRPPAAVNRNSANRQSAPPV